MAAPKYKILGEGSYGMVIQPALPNTIDGTNVYFPDNITKIYYSDDPKKNALETSRISNTIIGKNASHRTNTYSKVYTIGNLQENIKTQLKSRLQPWLTSDKRPLSILRMPYLGVDFHDLEKVVSDLQIIPINVFFDQVRKLIHQTANIARNNYAHFDIRLPNMIVNPTTGEIAIIDFDWLQPLPVLYRDYPCGYYSNPPELLFAKDLNKLMKSSNSDSSNITGTKYFDTAKFRSKLVTYLNNNMRANSHMFNKDSSEHELMDSLKYSMVSNLKFINKQMTISDMSVKDYIISTIFKYVDNYGLSTSLLAYMSTVFSWLYGYSEEDDKWGNLIYSVYTQDEFSDMYTAIIQAYNGIMSLLNNMCSYSIESRPTPNDAVLEIDNIITIFYNNVKSTDLHKLKTKLAELKPSGTTNVAARVAEVVPPAVNTNIAARVAEVVPPAVNTNVTARVAEVVPPDVDTNIAERVAEIKTPHMRKLTTANLFTRKSPKKTNYHRRTHNAKPIKPAAFVKRTTFKR